MKVCHMTSAHPSGDVRIFHKMCVSLAGAGYETYLVAPGDSFVSDGVTVLGVGEKPASRRKRMREMTRRVYEKAVSVDADLYHFHDPELLPWGLRLKRRGKAVIFDSHEFTGAQLATRTWIPSPLRRTVAALYRGYEAHICRRLDAVVVVCTLNGQDYFAGRAKRVCFVTNYPKLSEFADMMAGEPDAPEGLPYACYIGGLSASRGIDPLVQACQLAGVPLHLAGPFSTPAYEAYLRALPGWANVTYHGVLNRQAVSACIRGAMAGMSTLLNEGQYFAIDTLPIKVYEYMACGVPCIISDSPYNMRFIAENGCGLCVRPDDPQAIAQALRTLANNPAEARRMGENGRRAILEQFNWEKEAQKLIALYDDLLPEGA